MSTMTRQTHRFDLVLSAEVDDEAFGRLKRACRDDVVVGVMAGVPYAAFDREAPTLADAVLSAVGDVERAGVEGLVIEGVKADEPDDLDGDGLAFIGYFDALLRARRLAPQVASAWPLAERMLAPAS